MGFWRQKSSLLWNNPRFWQMLKLGFGYVFGPISLYSLKAAQDVDKPHRQWVFGVNNLVLKKYPKISTGVKWVFGDKNMVLLKCWNTARLWHVLILQFWYDVSPISLYFLKVPRFRQAKIGHGFFSASKIWFFWNTLRFWQVIYLTFWYNIGPKSLYSLKIPRFWQVKYAMGFWRQKTCFLWNNPRFWRVL